MPAATITTSQLATSPAITNTQLANHIAGIFTNTLGFTQVDSYVDTNEFRVFSYQYNGTSRGTAFLRFRIESGNYSIFLSDSWNSTTKIGTNESTVNLPVAINLSSGVNINFTAINHSEFKGVLVTQGSSYLGLQGLLRPNTKPAWWNEELDLFAFLPNLNSQNTQLRSTTTTLLTNPHKMLANPGLSHFNTNTSSRQFMKGVLLGNDGGDFGIFAKTSDDLIMVGGDGLAPGSTLIKQAGVEEYMYLGSNNASPYLAIRTV